MSRVMVRHATMVGLALTLLACGGGGDLAPQQPTVPARVSGVLLGTVSRPGGDFYALAFVSGDRFMAYDLGGVSYDGRFAISGGNVTADGVSVYAGNPVNRDFIRQVSETAPLSATVTTAGWRGSIAAAGGTITFDLDYDLETDAQDSSLSFLQDVWVLLSGASYRSELTIAADGKTATVNTEGGNPTGCNSSGQAGVIDARFGLYAWSTTLSGANCGSLATLPYTGLAILTDDTTKSPAVPLGRLTVLLANANYFLRLTPYERQP